MQIPIESLNMLLLKVGLAHHNADWNWQQVCSPFTRIYYVKEGGARIHFEDKCYELTPGNLYIIPAYTLHSCECHGLFTHYYLHVYEGFKTESNIFDYYDFPTEVKNCEDCERMFELMCQAIPEAKLPESNPLSYDNQATFSSYVHRYHALPLYQKMELRGIILYLFSRFMKNAVPKIWTTDKRMVKVLSYINDHICMDIDLEELADIAFVTKTYLIRLFKKHFGISPLQYINQKKVERAQLLLITEDMLVKEVAAALGFLDYSYFTRMFKKSTGKTPQEYRDTFK